MVLVTQVAIDIAFFAFAYFFFFGFGGGGGGGGFGFGFGCLPPRILSLRGLNGWRPSFKGLFPLLLLAIAAISPFYTATLSTN